MLSIGKGSPGRQDGGWGQNGGRERWIIKFGDTIKSLSGCKLTKCRGNKMAEMKSQKGPAGGG